MTVNLGKDFQDRLDAATQKAAAAYVPLLSAVGRGSVSTTVALKKATCTIIELCDELAIDMDLCAASDVACYLGNVITQIALSGRGPFEWFASQLQSQFRPHGMTGDLGVKLVGLSLAAIVHSRANNDDIVLGASRLYRYIEELYPVGENYIE